jgi:hypothetical protein
LLGARLKDEADRSHKGEEMNKKIIGTLAAAALAVGGLFGAAPWV